MNAKALALSLIVAGVLVSLALVTLASLAVIEDVAEVVEVVSAPILEPEGILVSIVKALFGLFGGFL